MNVHLMCITIKVTLWGALALTLCELMGLLCLCVSDSVHTLTCALMLLNTDLHGHVSLSI